MLHPFRPSYCPYLLSYLPALLTFPHSQKLNSHLCLCTIFLFFGSVFVAFNWQFISGCLPRDRGSGNKGCCVSNVVFISHDGSSRVSDRFPWRKGLKQMWTRPPAKSAFSLPFQFPSFLPALSLYPVSVSVFLSLVVRDCRVRDGRTIIILPGAKCF